MSAFKSFVFYSPLLWLRKIIVYVLGIAIVLGFVLYFVANSPLVIKKVAAIFAPDYNITYSRIYGNALTGIEIDNLAYNKEPLASYLALRWNPNGLIKKKIIVSKLEIEEVNVDTIKTLINSFSSDVNESEDANSSEPFAFEVIVHHSTLSVEPFVEQGITVESVTADIKDVDYSNEGVNIGNLSLKTDTNVTDLVLHAEMKDRRVTVKTLSISKLDALALEALFMPTDEENNTSSENNETLTPNKSLKDETSSNILIPKWVILDDLSIRLLPLKYDSVDIRSLEVKGSEAVFNVQKLLLEKANIDLNTTTNLSNVSYTTKVKNNRLIGTVYFKPKSKLFELYDLPIRSEAIGDVKLDLNASKQEVVMDLKITMHQLLKADKDAFNLDINMLHSHATYDINNGSLKAKSSVSLTTPYAENVMITNLFTMDENISYSGDMYTKEIIGVEAKFVKPFYNLKVHYSGDTKSIDTKIEADNLRGTFISKDFKKADLHLETKEPLPIREFVTLPPELNQTKANLLIDAPLSFEENATLHATMKVRSNVATMDANLSYKENLEIAAITSIPNESLLRPLSKELKWDHLNPIKLHAKLKDDSVDVQLNAGAKLKTKVNYGLSSEKIKGTIHLSGLEAALSGSIQDELNVSTQISSIPSLKKSIASIYDVGKLPRIDGRFDLGVSVSELSKATVTLNARQIVYWSDKDTEFVVNDISLKVEASASDVVLKKYALTYQEQKLFSTKPSDVSFVNGHITIAPLWLNDELKVMGVYDTNTSKGEVNATAKTLHINHEIVKLDSQIDIKTLLDGNKTSVKGKVTILGGNIYYDLGQQTYASDSDIMIVQELKEHKQSPFMDNLSVNVQVDSKKPLMYKKGAIDIKAEAGLDIYKAEQGELMVLGSVELLKGGSYIFKDKRFVLDKSYIYFTGNPNKPHIDATVNYKSLNYLITITINGAPDTLNINFSSVPSLSREQILSIILFDSEAGAGTNSGEDMMKMMGGAMAKSALADIGVKLDHLVLGAGNSVEVGKKLTDEMTIIYINDVIPVVKLKYEHSSRFESVISADEESQSYDIIYKRDF